MNFRCKFGHRRSIRRPRFPITVQHFSDFWRSCSLIYALYIYFNVAIFLLPVCSTYWPRKYTTRVDPTSMIPTRFEVDIIIHCRVIAFLSAGTSRDLVTLIFDLLTLNSCHTWRITWSTLPPSMKTLRLFVLHLWVITFVGLWKAAAVPSVAVKLWGW